MYLCQVNVSEILFPVTDPRFLKFSAGARIINRKVKEAPGFICGEQMYDDDVLFITRSVWESPEDLAAFIYSGMHRKFMDSAATWFKRTGIPGLALWYSDSPELPTLETCFSKMSLLRALGESDEVKGADWLSGFV